MALKRNYESPSTKYLYVKVSRVVYSKTDSINFGLLKTEKDNEDPQYEKVLHEAPQYVVAHDESPDLFSMAAMNELNNNPIKAAYDWLKVNEDLFRDFIDC